MFFYGGTEIKNTDTDTENITNFYASRLNKMSKLDSFQQMSFFNFELKYKV